MSQTKHVFHGGVAEHIAELAARLGADGIIAPATRPDRVRLLRKIAGKRKIYSPGVGAQGGDASLLAELVDGIIAGRQIYNLPTRLLLLHSLPHSACDEKTMLIC